MGNRADSIILIDSNKEIRNGPTTVATGPQTAQITDLDLNLVDDAEVNEFVEANNINQFTEQEVRCVKFADSVNLDAFGRLRVSNPAYLFDSQFTYDISPDTWDTLTDNGTIAHDTTERWAALSVTATANAEAILQSHYNLPYTPGRSHLAFITFLFGAVPGTGVSKRVGLYDEDNAYGVYLEQTNTDTRFVIVGGTSNGTQTVSQNDWNIDHMDGLGPSEQILDLTKTQILIINLQALYVGEVVLGFNINGIIYAVHKFKHANNIVFPYIKQASLPIHYSVRTGTTAVAANMKAICASVMNEGGVDLHEIAGRRFSVSNGTTTIGVTSRRPILSIRVLEKFNNINQNALIIPTDIELFASTNTAYLEVILNGTLSGASFASVNTTYSVTAFDVAATTISGGILVETHIVPASANVRNTSTLALFDKVILAYSHLLGVGDTLSIVVTSFTGTSTVSGSIGWKEIR